MGVVSAAFEDNTTAEGCILIGADGARSTVRGLLLGSKIAELKQLSYVATFVQAKYTREQALFLRSFHPLNLASPHPKGKFAFFCTHEVLDPKKPETWTFNFYISWPVSIHEQNQRRNAQIDHLGEVKELAKDYAEPWRSAFQWLPDNQNCYHSVLNAWDPESARWSTLGGKVTLLGDAAHPMSYQRGQGLNHSMLDCEKLLHAMTAFMLPKPPAGLPPIPESSGLAQADVIAAYEAEMRVRAGKEVRLGIENTEMLHNWEKVIDSPALRIGVSCVMVDSCEGVQTL